MMTMTIWDFADTYEGGRAFYAAGGCSNHIDRSAEFQSGYLDAKREAGDTSCRRVWVAEIQSCPDCHLGAPAHTDNRHGVSPAQTES